MYKLAIKIGGSVLSNEDSYRLQAQRIDKIIEEYNPFKLYVVTSAKKGETDRLIEEVAKNLEDEIFLRKALKGEYIQDFIFREYNKPSIATRLLQGEINSAYLLREYLGDARVIVQDRHFPIVSASNLWYIYGFIDEQESYSRKAYLDVPEQIVIIPGFGAVNRKGEKVLLGRNSSDLVAAMIALLTNADKLIYLKDVEGIYRNFGQDNKEVIPMLQHQEAMNMEIGEVLDKKVLDLLKGSKLEVIIGHHEHLNELVESNSKYGTKIKLY